ncbi:phosphoribosylglycinamide formyltransferase [Leptobacterium sp. I13]|uniref:phosphoribosylglycinamide formyltransferase n=1 Tax=Leptobacterium meishanense TaxID=3128904 RepID=UPI0030EBF172
MKKIILFASGSGTNAENIIRYFKRNPSVEISAVFANKKTAKVLERADEHGVSALYFNKFAFNTIIPEILKTLNPDLIVLAGFLWKFPKAIIATFPNKIINIHPALLPKYGGKGMYGIHVHNAVCANKESQTGITIHFVNENYDDGAIIFQAETNISPSDTPNDIAHKVHLLEQKHFPVVIEKLLNA